LSSFFSKAELTENERKKEKLIELLRAGEAILMAGAGCSASLYPDWLTLIHLLHSEALRVDPTFAPFNKEADNYLSYADELKKCLGQDRFYNVIFQCFKPKNPGEKRFEKFHQVLCRFLIEGKLRGISTTPFLKMRLHLLLDKMKVPYA
jgi:hypothetical protein